MNMTDEFYRLPLFQVNYALMIMLFNTVYLPESHQITSVHHRLTKFNNDTRVCIFLYY